MSTPISDIQNEEKGLEVVTLKETGDLYTKISSMIDYKNIFFLFISSFLAIKVSLNDVRFLENFMQYNEIIRAILSVLIYHVLKFFLA
jgi:hypothetical protein